MGLVSGRSRCKRDDLSGIRGAELGRRLQVESVLQPDSLQVESGFSRIRLSRIEAASIR